MKFYISIMAGVVILRTDLLIVNRFRGAAEAGVYGVASQFSFLLLMLPGVIASLSNDAEFFPGLKKSWSYTFMVNDEEAPTGRPAGALGWAGLPNLFYWIDRKNGFGGYWATQILPFGDPTSFGAYLDFETAAYATGEARAAA